MKQLFLCLALVSSSFSLTVITPLVGAASAAENQSSPPTDGQGGGGHDCEHEKKDETVS